MTRRLAVEGARQRLPPVTSGTRSTPLPFGAGTPSGSKKDTLKQRPRWIRLIIEFLGTFLLVTVAAGSGVINQYVGGGPINRAAAVFGDLIAVLIIIMVRGIPDEAETAAAEDGALQSI